MCIGCKKSSRWSELKSCTVLMVQPLVAAAPAGNHNSTSKSQTSSWIRTIKRDYAVIIGVTFIILLIISFSTLKKVITIHGQLSARPRLKRCVNSRISLALKLLNGVLDKPLMDQTRTHKQKRSDCPAVLSPPNRRPQIQ